MLRLPCFLRLSLLVSAVAIVGLATFPGTAAEASSPAETAASASDPQPALDIDALLAAAESDASPVRSDFRFEGYRR